VDYNEQSTIQMNERRVYRFRPRYNPEVNSYWMCDMGRYGYRAIDSPSRIPEPLLREGKRLTPVGWDSVLKRAVLRIKEVMDQEGPEGIGLIIYPSVSYETALMARMLFLKHLGIHNVSTGPSVDPSEYEDQVLIRRDRFPNRWGLKQAGFPSGAEGMELEKILNQWGKGEIKLLYVIGDDLPRLPDMRRPSFLFGTDGILILQKSTTGPEDEYARMILPSAMFVEEEGTYINFEGKAQHYDSVIAPYGESLPSWKILMRLAELFGLDLKPENWKQKIENRK
jgi:NADH-quinone oxidoreductase subunit G